MSSAKLLPLLAPFARNSVPPVLNSSATIIALVSPRKKNHSGLY
jgi:hypothetical protein